MDADGGTGPTTKTEIQRIFKGMERIGVGKSIKQRLSLNDATRRHASMTTTDATPRLSKGS
jgi:hypothetical protein